MKEDSKFTVEWWEGIVIEEMMIKDYFSGTIFLNLQATINKTERKKMRKLFGKKEDDKPEVDPYAPKNGVNLKTVQLEEGDLLLHNNKKDHFAYLDEFIAKQLQPHQVHGIKFLYSAINNLNGSNIKGCILADMMGLGKTLQAIALIWVMVKTCKVTNV